MGGLRLAAVALLSAMASAFLVTHRQKSHDAEHVHKVAAAPVSLPAKPTSEGDVKELEEKLAALEERVSALDELDLWVEATRLGVSRELVMANTGLTPRQEQRLAVAIVREAKKNSLDPLLVTALIRVESSFNNFAVSNVGALGLMQIMPDTGKWLSDKTQDPLKNAKYLFEPEKNVALGTAYLASLIKQMGGLEPALLAYNAGPGAAKRILAGADRKAREKAFEPYARKVLGEYARLVRTAKPLTGGVQTASREAAPNVQQ